AAAVGVGNAPAGGAVADRVENANPAVPREPCPNQGNYVLYCYRNDPLTGLYPGGGFGASFVYPVGRIRFAALDATSAPEVQPPPPGTTIRFVTADPLFGSTATSEVAAVSAGPSLQAVYPNPLRSAAEVIFRVGRPGPARVTVYDVLGRAVAVLAEGPVGAGERRVRLEGARLAAGVYLVVLEAQGERRAQRVTVLR
ncbi:MAG: T9SS type A sorting domain-containing protein, partial [Rhodothermales bacterium]|nr:T9SS type A sorting domain-containing protein [Rhodothermales bacterium]